MGIDVDLVVDGAPKKRFDKAKKRGSRTILKVEPPHGSPQMVGLELKRGSISAEQLADEQARIGRALVGAFALVSENFDTLSYLAAR